LRPAAGGVQLARTVLAERPELLPALVRSNHATTLVPTVALRPNPEDGQRR
jgi:hypothetical protein